MAEAEYRKAERDDFPKILSLIRSSYDNLLREHGFFDSSPFASHRLPPIPPPGGSFPWYERALKEDAEGFWVAQVGDKLAGIALSWVRGSLWYLAHLFISPDQQGKDIGRHLMDRAMQHRKKLPITNRALITLAYNPVSIALYGRCGIYPREPLYWMDCPTQNVTSKATHTALKFERAADYLATQEILSSIDEQGIGYAHDRNHDFLFTTPTIKCYIFSSEHEPVGYAYIHQNGRIGPLATVSETLFEDAVKSALGLAAAEKSPSVSFLATGSNGTLMKIGLSNGMRILDNSLFMSSHPFPNFSQYMLYPMGSML